MAKTTKPPPAPLSDSSSSSDEDPILSIPPSQKSAKKPIDKKKAKEVVTKEKPPAVPAVDESEHDSDDSDSDSDSEPLVSTKKAKVKEVAPKEKVADAPSLDDSDDSDSESEPLSATKKAKVNKVAPKEKAAAAPAVDEPEQDSDDSDSESETLLSTKKAKVKEVAPKPSTPAKRARSVDEEKSLAAKKEKSAGGSTLFQRLWSEEDEIVLLQGMVDYRAEKGVDPMLDYSNFYNYIKDALHGDFELKQLINKVRGLLNRYKTFLDGKKKSMTPHEQTTCDLSKLVWGATLDKPAATKPTKKGTRATPKAAPASNGKARDASNGGKKREVVEEMEVDDDDTGVAPEPENSWNYVGKYSISIGMDEVMVNEALKRMDKAKKADIEETWKQIYLDEALIFSRKLEIAKTESSSIIELIRNK